MIERQTRLHRVIWMNLSLQSTKFRINWLKARSFQWRH